VTSPAHSTSSAKVPRWLKTLGALLLYLGCALYVTWPLLG
jgi:hypothetical protein